MKTLRRIPGILFLLLATLSGPALGLGSAPPPGENDPQWEVSNLQFFPQQKTKWCWAAAAQSVLSSRLEKVPPQCEIVSRVLGRDCCARSHTCDQGNWPANAAWSAPRCRGTRDLYSREHSVCKILRSALWPYASRSLAAEQRVLDCFDLPRRLSLFFHAQIEAETQHPKNNRSISGETNA